MFALVFFLKIIKRIFFICLIWTRYLCFFCFFFSFSQLDIKKQYTFSETFSTMRKRKNAIHIQHWQCQEANPPRGQKKNFKKSMMLISSFIFNC